MMPNHETLQGACFGRLINYRSLAVDLRTINRRQEVIRSATMRSSTPIAALLRQLFQRIAGAAAAGGVFSQDAALHEIKYVA